MVNKNLTKEGKTISTGKKALGIVIILFGILLLIGSSGFTYIAFIWARSIPMGTIFLFLIALSIVLLVFGVKFIKKK